MERPDGHRPQPDLRPVVARVGVRRVVGGRLWDLDTLDAALEGGIRQNRLH